VELSVPGVRAAAERTCGEESWVALQYIKQLIEAAHSKGLPATSLAALLRRLAE